MFATGGRRALCVCGFVGLLPRELEIACIDLAQTGSVGEGSDHLQVIKFWQFCATGKGVCGGAKFFSSALLQPARRVYIAPSAFSFSSCMARHGVLQCARWVRLAVTFWPGAISVTQLRFPHWSLPVCVINCINSENHDNLVIVNGRNGTHVRAERGRRRGM